MMVTGDLDRIGRVVRRVGTDYLAVTEGFFPKYRQRSETMADPLDEETSMDRTWSAVAWRLMPIDKVEEVAEIVARIGSEEQSPIGGTWQNGVETDEAPVRTGETTKIVRGETGGGRGAEGSRTAWGPGRGRGRANEDTEATSRGRGGMVENKVLPL